MVEVHDLVKILERQGLTVQRSKDDQGARYYVEGDGAGYVLRGKHLKELQLEKKLNLAGIRELSEKLRHKDET